MKNLFLFLCCLISTSLFSQLNYDHLDLFVKHKMFNTEDSLFNLYLSHHLPDDYEIAIMPPDMYDVIKYDLRDNNIIYKELTLMFEATDSTSWEEELIISTNPVYSKGKYCGELYDPNILDDRTVLILGDLPEIFNSEILFIDIIVSDTERCESEEPFDPEDK